MQCKKNQVGYSINHVNQKELAIVKIIIHSMILFIKFFRGVSLSENFRDKINILIYTKSIN